MKTCDKVCAVLLIGLAGGLVAHADVILAGWGGAVHPTNTTFRGADVLATGFAGTQSWNATDGSHWSGWSANGSDDLTFGTLGNGAVESTNVGTGAILTKALVPVWMDYTIVNNSAQAYELTAFVFDAWRQNNSALSEYSLSVVGGDLALTNGIASGSFVAKGALPGAAADYDDFDILLTGLADRTLGVGESVTFRLDFSAGSGSNFYLDNVAVLGVIPEPATLGLVAVSSLGLVFLRRLF